MTRESRVDEQDRSLASRMRAELDPGERPPARRAAFVAGLEARIRQPRRRPRWAWAWASTAAAAGAALVLWLAVPAPGPQRAQSAATSQASLLAYAFYETDYLGENPAGEDSFMSDEYLAIAAAFEIE